MSTIELLKNYGVGAVLFVIAVWLAKLWLENVIKTTMNTLQTRELEKLKAYNARMLNNFGLYNQNRHESYAKLHELLLIAHSSLRSRAPTLVTRYTYDEFGTDDIGTLLTELRVPTKEIGRICNRWDVDRDGAREEIYRWQDIVAGNEMEKAVGEFHNEYLRRELYLSDTVAQKLREIDGAILTASVYGKRDQLDDYSGRSVLPEVARYRGERREKLESTLSEIEALQGKLRTLMQAEMRIGQGD